MTTASMIKAFISLVDLFLKSIRYLKNKKLISKIEAIKKDLLEVKFILEDVIASAERSIELVGLKTNITEFEDSYIIGFGKELIVQLSRLNRINEIIKDNNLISIDSSLKKDFDKLIKWKEGILFRYGASIEFFGFFGFQKSKESSKKQQLFDLYRFCFLNAEPEQHIDIVALSENIKELKTINEKFTSLIKEFMSADEVVKFFQEARQCADIHSTPDPFHIAS